MIFQEPMTSLDPMFKIGHEIKASFQLRYPGLYKTRRKTLVEHEYSHLEFQAEWEQKNDRPFIPGYHTKENRAGILSPIFGDRSKLSKYHL